MIEMTYEESAQREVAWYRQNGKYPHRLVRDSKGVQYVMGDWSWNRRHRPCPNCNRPYTTEREVIEPQMRAAIAGRAEKGS